MKRRVTIAELMIFVLLTLLAGSEGSARDLNIGWPGSGSWTTLPYIVAAEKEFFQKEDLRVRMITFRGINVLMAALMSGELDYATILPTIAVSAARGIPVKVLGSVSKGSSFALISRAEIGNVQALRGKRIGINSFGSSLDYVTYAAISRSGLDPSRDVIILPIGATTADRVAALSSGSIDAMMVTSPFEYSAEKQGFHVLMSAHELAQLVRIANTGIGATHKKMQREPDEVVRVLRALRLATLLIQEQREYGVGLFERILRFDRSSAEKFYGLFREQYNPELVLPDTAIADLLAIATFRSKEKEKVPLNTHAVHDWSFADKARR